MKLDARSTTGSNLRIIALLTDRSSVDKLEINDYKAVNYHPISDQDIWRTEIIKEITDVKFNQLEVPGFTFEEMEEILSFACTS